MLDPRQLHALEQQLESLLRAAHEELSEYDLLQQLREAGIQPFSELEFHDSYALFQAHFILFHALHHLQARLHSNRIASISISPLRICWRDYEPSQPGLTGHDPMAAYYLDLDNLHATNADKVTDMLGRFWSGMGDYDKRAQALQVLDLAEGADADTIRKRYRQLAMEHHPDRGGSKDRLQMINAAADVLLGRRQRARRG